METKTLSFLQTECIERHEAIPSTLSGSISDNVIEAGFKLDVGKTPTARVSIDSTYSQKILGFEFAPYKEQIHSLSDHYLELLELELKAGQ